MALGKKLNISTCEYELKTDEGEATGVVFTLQSANAPAVKKVAKETQLDALFDAKAFDVESPTEDQERAFKKAQFSRSAHIFAACVTDWNWNGAALYEDDEPFDKPCTYDNVLEVLDAPIDGIDILAQVSEQVAQLGKPKAAPKKPA